jgi:NADH-quinone oxidoreductase subunit A
VCEFESRRPHQINAGLPTGRWAKHPSKSIRIDPNWPLFIDLAMNLDQYLPVLLFILVGVGVGVVPQVLGRLLGPVRPDAEKNSPYECGFEAFEDARMKFDVRYYLVAILFILFDLEIAFLFPWAVALKEIGAVGFWSVMVFLGILVVGFIYEWKKGALDWE